MSPVYLNTVVVVVDDDDDDDGDDVVIVDRTDMTQWPYHTRYFLSKTANQKSSRKNVFESIEKKQGGLQVAWNGLKRFYTIYTLRILWIALNGLERFCTIYKWGL